MRKVLYIFGLLTDGDIEWMAKNGTCRRLSDGELLIEEGGTSDSLILLLEGELQVTAKGYGAIARMGVGEIVGEVSLVDSAPPSATTRCRWWRSPTGRRWPPGRRNHRTARSPGHRGTSSQARLRPWSR